MPLQRPLEVAATSDFGSEVFYYIVSDVCKISKFEDGHANGWLKLYGTTLTLHPFESKPDLLVLLYSNMHRLHNNTNHKDNLLK